MRMQFANYGKVNVGDECCDRCKDLMFNPKRNGRDGNPGIILQCRQGSPYAKCCHCTISGDDCSNKLERNEVDTVRAGGPGRWQEVSQDLASLFLDFEDEKGRLDPEDPEDVAAFTKAHLDGITDKLKAIREGAIEGAKLAAPLRMEEYTEKHEDHGEIRRLDGTVAELYVLES